MPREEVPEEIATLYYATLDYVEMKGGKLVACMGVQIQEWPEDGPGSFRVAILCKGDVPDYAKASPCAT